MAPCCRLLVKSIGRELIEMTVLGPDFSVQVWSINWVATFWLNIRVSLGKKKCTSEGKNPSMFEKWCGLMLGTILCCFEVIEASSHAEKRPSPARIKAEILISRGIDIRGVFVGKMFVVINSPAIMLPQARRFRGLMVVMFSLIGGKGIDRGLFINAK